MMTTRVQVTMSVEWQRRARERAAELGVSFAEYIRRLVERDLGEPAPTADPAVLFNLGDSGGSDIARHKDRYVSDAFGALDR
jgi:hypothetical protein